MPLHPHSQQHRVTGVYEVDPEGRFVFAGNYGLGTSTAGSNGLGSVSAYTINATTGALTPVSGSPFAAGYGLNWLVIHPSGKYLYAVNEGSNNVPGFAIDQVSGGLTPVVGSPFATPPLSIRAELSSMLPAATRTPSMASPSIPTRERSLCCLVHPWPPRLIPTS
jgi:hypothetical protein